MADHPSTDYDLIQRFLDFELSEAELAIVEQRLKNDAVFQERLARYQAMESHIEGGNIKEARVVALPTVRSIWKRGTAIAAMIVLAIGLLFVLRLFSTDHEGAQVLAQNYWEGQKEWSTQIRTFSETLTAQDSLFKVAITAAENENWEVALAHLNQLQLIDNQLVDTYLLKGKIYQAQADYEAAIREYDQFITTSNSRQDEAYWYRALAYIQSGEFDKAKSDLELIIAADYPFAERAKELLRKL
ncbi:MAG: tetratricopeptide repeat protein [Bacteroidota bacterium]